MNAREKVRTAVRIGGFGALTAGLLPGFVAHSTVARLVRQPTDGVRDAWVTAWSDAMLRLFGVRVVTEGALPSRAGPRLVVANHRSTADILVLLRAFGGRMVSRADLAKWPLVGVAARSVGTLFVDRADAASGAAALRSMRTHLTAGSAVIVFPEGTTFPGDEVRPFHAGAFVAAARAGAEVVPVGIAYQTGSGAQFFGESFPVHLARMAAAEPSRVALCVGPVLRPDDHRRAADMRSSAQAAVQDLVLRARAIVDASVPGP
jgi:1-acyl-sn-glycerol-3-phosphate acyltransferase